MARRRLMAIDGTSFDVADTPDNEAHFGRVGSGPKASAYPKLQVMALAECGSHAVVGAVLGTAHTGERTLAADLVGMVEPGMLVAADAGLFSWELFNTFADTGADLAWRIGASVSVGHIRWHSDGSYLALIFKPGLSAARRARLVATAKAGGQVPDQLARLVRVVEYTVPDRNPDGELIAVVTTIVDPKEVSALELAGVYHQRWEEQSAIDEIKTDLRGRGEVLRSKSPALVEQQMWGCCWPTTPSGRCCARPPTRPATTPTGSRLYAAYVWSAARSPTRRPFPPEHLAEALIESKQEILRRLNPKRRHRTCPRA